jgi:nitroreductase
MITTREEMDHQEAAPLDPGQLQELIKSRRSTRAFRTESVPRETIIKILKAAQTAPSDCNTQPWRVFIISGDRLNQLREAMYECAITGAEPVADIAPIKEYRGVYKERRRECGWQLYSTLGIEKGDRTASARQALENFRFFGAPHLAVITTHESLGARGAVDCGAYMATFLLAAHAAGVATVPQASIAFRADVIREQLALPQEDHIVFGISFGWADEEHVVNSYRTVRADVAEVVTFLE